MTITYWTVGPAHPMCFDGPARRPAIQALISEVGVSPVGYHTTDNIWHGERVWLPEVDISARIPWHTFQDPTIRAKLLGWGRDVCEHLATKHFPDTPTHAILRTPPALLGHSGTHGGDIVYLVAALCTGFKPGPIRWRADNPVSYFEPFNMGAN